MVDIDIKTVEKAQKGDKSAFDRIITLSRQQVINICRRYMRNDEEACDMAQEVFCAAYNAIKGFEMRSKFSTWLYRICVNLWINRLDALKRRKYFDTASIHGDEEDGRYGFDMPDTARKQDEEYEASEARRLVMSALESFSDEDRTVIILRDMQELEYEEISAHRKIPLGSVKSRLSRAREKLKEKLLRKMGGKNEMQ